MESGRLNRKLAEWAGFEGIELQEYSKIHPELEMEDYYAGRYPSGIFCPKIDFTQSLDACFKWLVPRLEFYLLDSELNTKGLSHHAVVRFKGRRVQQWADTPAHAFCLAIDKLID